VKYKVIGRYESLEAARIALKQLDYEVGPRVYQLLSDAFDRTPLGPTDMDAVRGVAQEMSALLKSARERLADQDKTVPANYPAKTLGDIDREIARILLLLREVPPDCQRIVLRNANRYLRRAERLVRITIAQIEIEIACQCSRRTDSWRDRGTAAPRKRPHRPRDPNHEIWYAEIVNLRPIYGTWKKAVDQFNQLRGASHTVDAVKKWGTRLKKRNDAA